MKKSVLFLCCASISGCAHISQADYAQTADVVTTAVGLSNGLSEANSIWGDVNWPVMAVVKLGATQAVKLAPEPYCTSGLMGLTIAGYGAAFWNVGVMLGSGPLAIPVAVGVLGWQWENLAQDSMATCNSTGVGFNYFKNNSKPYSYSGPTCHGWDNARPDRCASYFVKHPERL